MKIVLIILMCLIYGCATGINLDSRASRAKVYLYEAKKKREKKLGTTPLEISQDVLEDAVIAYGLALRRGDVAVELRRCGSLTKRSGAKKEGGANEAERKPVCVDLRAGRRSDPSGLSGALRPGRYSTVERLPGEAAQATGCRRCFPQPARPRELGHARDGQACVAPVEGGHAREGHQCRQCRPVRLEKPEP